MTVFILIREQLSQQAQASLVRRAKKLKREDTGTQLESSALCNCLTLKLVDSTEQASIVLWLQLNQNSDKSKSFD